jgi:hypothetical protein
VKIRLCRATQAECADTMSTDEREGGDVDDLMKQFRFDEMMG